MWRLENTLACLTSGRTTHTINLLQRLFSLFRLCVPQLSCRGLRAAVLLFEGSCSHAGASTNPVRYAEGCGKGHFYFIKKKSFFFFFCLEYADSTVGLSAGYNSRRCQGGSSGELLGD